MIYRIIFVATILAAFVKCGIKPERAEVYFIPTIHVLHKTNSSYTYDSLRNVIKRINPDVIAVELRPEDINADSVYLSKNYPLEMRMMKSWFPAIKVEGIDWLGADIAGRRIPDNYWKELAEIKKHERSKASDSTYYAATQRCNELQKMRVEILQKASLKELITGRDTELTRSFYSCQNDVYGQTVHNRVLDFYRERDRNMLINIKNLLANNRSKRIVILAGADHFGMLRDKFPNRPLY